MGKWILASCLATAIVLGGQSLVAHADHGNIIYGGHGHHSHYAPNCGYSGYRGYSSSPYRYGGYSPYGYGSYYGSPGIVVSRSSYYSGGYRGNSAYGWGGYGNVGYLSPHPTTLPRVQLRIGF